MVEILAASVFPTDLVTLLYDGAGFLPTVVLTDARWSELQRRGAKELTGAEKCRFTSVLATHDLVAMPERSLEKMTAFWRRVVRTYKTSRTMPSTVVKLFHGNAFVKFYQVFRVLGLFVQPRGLGTFASRIKMIWQRRPRRRQSAT